MFLVWVTDELSIVSSHSRLAFSRFSGCQLASCRNSELFHLFPSACFAARWKSAVVLTMFRSSGQL